MARFFTSDLHFGHRNVIAFCDRPYKDVDEMNAAIIKQWNSQVGPDDEVYFLGDFGINKRKALDEKLVGSLNGIKYIILGNHDSGFVRLHKGQNRESIKNQYKKAGWHFADISLIRTLKNGQRCILTHLPMSMDEDARYIDFRVSSIRPDLVHLHGHLHGHYRKKGNAIDVCFDGDLKLLSEDDIIDIIEDERDFIPTRLTQFYKKVDVPSLQKYEEEVAKKNLRKQVDGDLVLYNYSDQCTYDRAWNETTLSARGIVFDTRTGRRVAMPFPKFFNLGEMPETRLENLPNESYVVTEKMDGSLGIIYHHDGRWRVNTRGSFNSEQAQRAEEILKRHRMDEVPTELTLLVEIIYPENKIVVNYGDQEKLTLLGAINRETGEELGRKTMDLVHRDTGMELVKEFNYTIEEMIELQKTIPKDEEGFVVRYESGLRVKLKGDEYFKVHKLISQMSPISFWESMEEGVVKIDYLTELPEEYRKEAEEITFLIEASYVTVLTEIKWSVDNMLKEIGFGCSKTNEYKKKIGLYIKDKNPLHASAIFPFMLGNDVAFDKYIMKTIRPTGNVIL